MKKRQRSSTSTISLLIALVAIAAVTRAAPEAPAEPLTTDNHDWHEGAEAFDTALEKARDEKRAVAVYFYTDRCGYCGQLENMLLERGEVKGYLEDLTRIRINPEDGTNERRIAQRYRVDSFPAFFVHPAADRGPSLIERAVEVGCTWRLKSPEEFISSIQLALGDLR
jgi:thioredoxin-related protein